MIRVLVSVCFLLSACGEVVPVDGAVTDGGDDRSDGGADQPDADPADICAGPSIALQDIETCFVRMQCEFMVRCFPGFPDVAFCEPRVFDFFSSLSDGGGDPGEGGDDGAPSRLFFDIFKRAVTANVANFDGEKAYQCLLSLRDGSCKNDNDNKACEYILTGNVADGQDCFDDFECRSGSYCARDDESSCSSTGRCQAGLDVGADCSVDRCLPELHCVFMGGGGGNNAKCENGGEGAACSGNNECNADRYCSTGQVCVPDVAGGADCTLDAECPGDQFCVFGSCAEVSEVGALCDGFCTGNLYCPPAGTPDAQQCTPLPGPTQNCSNVPNLGFGRCDNVDNFCGGPSPQSCVPRIPAGAPCPGQASGNCALGTFCDSELGAVLPKCTNPRGDGADCAADKHCSSEYCESPGGTEQSSCQTYVACWE